MRKLTPKEVTALCALLSTCALGSKRVMACEVGVPCTLPPVVVQACGDCELVAPDIEFTPFNDPGTGYTIPTVDIPGDTVPPFNPSNNPNCATPAVDTSDIKSFIMQNEGADPAVQGMAGKYYGKPLTNESGYVPWTNASSSCAAGPSCVSGLTTDGVDLSEWYPNQLEAQGAPASIFTSLISNTFMPHTCELKFGIYVTCQGAKGSAALSLIEAYTDNGAVPFFTAAEAQELNNAAYGAVLTNLRDNIGSVDFAQLPNNTQQALMDFAWNQDAGYLTSTGVGQTVQSYVENGEWLILADYLEANGGLRGALDAAKIKQDIASGKLPEYGKPC